jgi:two-component system, OmpR family, response regulator
MMSTFLAIEVVVVEDHLPLLEEMQFQLKAEGFAVRGASDAASLDALLAEKPCDILVLDLNLPGEDGYSVARRLCDRRRLGIIMLTSRDTVEDKLRGFADGADLYLTKPIDRRELVACIKALYSRVAPHAPLVQEPQWILNHALRQLIGPNGNALDLTVQDLTVLAVLAAQPGQTVERKDLVRALGIDYLEAPEGRTNTILSRLRQKLAMFDPDLRIVAWRNKGYSYVGPVLQIHPGNERA